MDCPSAPNTSYDVLLSSRKLSLWFACKQVRRILFFILDIFLCLIICFTLITKQLILPEYGKENLHTDKLVGAEKVNTDIYGFDQQG